VASDAPTGARNLPGGFGDYRELEFFKLEVRSFKLELSNWNRELEVFQLMNEPGFR
jgi:hypothetical protein